MFSQSPYVCAKWAYNRLMTMRDIATRINYFRMEKNKSARDLSLAIDKSESYLTQFESRCFNLSTGTLLKLIEALEIEPEEFFAKDYRNYSKNILIDEEYEKLSDDQKEVVLSVLRNFRK